MTEKPQWVACSIYGSFAFLLIFYHGTTCFFSIYDFVVGPSPSTLFPLISCEPINVDGFHVDEFMKCRYTYIILT